MKRGTRTSTKQRGFSHVCTYHGIEEYELRANGLRVLYRFDDTAPVAGLMVSYLVGSRHEAVGHTGATHALAVLIDLDDGADRIEFAGTICLAIANGNDMASRRSRIVGGRDWVRLGAIEMGLDCLRRYLHGLPVDERIDFEKIEMMDAGPAPPKAVKGEG